MLTKLISIFIKFSHLFLIGSINTIVIAMFAIIIGFAGGLFLGLLNSKKLSCLWWKIPIDFYVLIIRGTPIYVQVLLVYYALPELIGINLSPFSAGLITLGVNSTAYMTEIIRAGINAIPDGQWEACSALGYDTYTTLASVILPQTIKIVFPALTNEFIALLKQTSILSVIGLMELTKIGTNISAQTLDPLSAYTILAVIYLLLTTTVTIIAKKLEMGLDYDKCTKFNI
jgi:His/Glu/Gln/Arg/opine family amino acid ABC transporter permease subunit